MAASTAIWCTIKTAVLVIFTFFNPENFNITTTRKCPSLEETSSQMWVSDVNRLKADDVIVDYQNQIPDHTRTDNSSEKLFSYVNETKLSGPTFQTYLSLLDNYFPVKGDLEVDTLNETQEVEAFLDAILDTKVMDVLYDYLSCEGIVENKTDFRTTLRRIWFDHYPRSGKSNISDTSGFEHIMVGEFKTSATVNGFHSWLSFYEKEKAGELDYYGYVNKGEPGIIGAAFSWANRVKPLGSFIIGVSPEFDIALYSLCFLALPGRNCPVELGGYKREIRTYTKDGLIATAFIAV